MMFAYCIKFFKNKSFLLFLLFISFIYFFFSISRMKYSSHSKLESTKPIPQVHQIDWAVDKKDSNRSETCRNSMQGLHLITDDRGHTCPRSAVLANQCCPRSFKLHSCRTCHENHCCAVFEYCISCCLAPDNRLRLRKTFLRNMRVFPYLFSSVQDVFELCLSICRTSSQSVHHENTYRDSNAKYCYGDDVPSMKIRKEG